MLVNPGGPGGSGLGLSILGELRAQRCRRHLRLDRLRPARRRRERAGAVAATRRTSGYDRPHYVPASPAISEAGSPGRRPTPTPARRRTARSARAPEDASTRSRTWRASARRSAQKQINYYGFSYGTYLGQVYATLYPTQVRRMVLDGNVDPRSVWYDANLDQDVRVRPQHQHLVRLGRQVRQRLPPRQDPEGGAARCSTRAQDKLDANPAGQRGKLGGDEWTDVFLVGGLLPVRRGPTSRTRSPPGSTSGDSPRSRTRTASTPAAPATTTGTRSTSASSAPTLRGRRSGAPGRRTTTRLHEGAVPDLGQRLVQRAVPVLAGQGRASR